MSLQDEVVTLYERGLTTRQVSAELGVSAMTVVRALRKRNRKARPRHAHMYRLTSANAKELAREYAAGANTRDLQRKYNVSDSTVIRCVKNEGYLVRGDTRLSRQNNNAFNALTPAGAYWLGFLLVAKYQVETIPGLEPSFTVTVPQKKKWLLEGLRSFLRVSKRMRAVKGPARIKIVSRNLINKLWTLGVGASEARYCRDAEAIQMPELWRGVLDGAGSIEKDVVTLPGSPRLQMQFVRYVRSNYPQAASSIVDGVLCFRDDTARFLIEHLYPTT